MIPIRLNLVNNFWHYSYPQSLSHEPRDGDTLRIRRLYADKNIKEYHWVTLKNIQRTFDENGELKINAEAFLNTDQQ